MILSDIEKSILIAIGYDRYSDLSVDTDATKIDDFAMLHRCVNIARDEIRLNTIIPALLKHATVITTVAGTKQYTISDTDFDIPVKAYFTDSGGSQKELIKVSPINILDKIATLTTAGTPICYQIFGSTSAGLSYIELLPVDDVGGTLDIDYKPVLTDVTLASGEDTIMKKYPLTVIKIAIAWAAQFIKKDDKLFDKFILLGRADFKEINLREINSDPDNNLQVDSLLAKRRVGRLTI